MDYSRLEAGQVEIEAAPFDLADLLREVIGAHESAATAKGLTLELRSACRLPRIWWAIASV